MSSSKTRWPLNAQQRESLAKRIARVDAARLAFRESERNDETEGELLEANEKLLKVTAAMSESYRFFKDERGFETLGAPHLSPSEMEVTLPDLGIGEEYLATEFDDPHPDQIEDEEGRDYERGLRVAAKTGWFGLDAKERKWLTRLRDNARELASAASAWLEATK